MARVLRRHVAGDATVLRVPAVSEPREPGRGSPESRATRDRVVEATGRSASERARIRGEFGAFYEGRLASLVAYVIYLGARHHDALEIAQETMRKAYENWTAIDTPLAWTRTVAGRMYVRRATSLDHEVAFADQHLPPHPATTSDHSLADVVARHDIVRMVAHLPHRQRQIVAMTYDGATATEIASDLGMAPATVRSHLRHARAALARRLTAADRERGGQ